MVQKGDVQRPILQSGRLLSVGRQAATAAARRRPPARPTLFTLYALLWWRRRESFVCVRARRCTSGVCKPGGSGPAAPPTLSLSLTAVCTFPQRHYTHTNRLQNLGMAFSGERGAALLLLLTARWGGGGQQRNCASASSSERRARAAAASIHITLSHVRASPPHFTFLSLFCSLLVAGQGVDQQRAAIGGRESISIAALSLRGEHFPWPRC